MDKAKGKTNQVKGQVKEKLGEAADHQNLKAEGKGSSKRKAPR